VRINPELLVPNVIGGLQEAKFKSEITGEMTKEDYINALIRGFFALYYEGGNIGIALNLKSEFEQYKNELPPWMKYYWKFDRDYDLTEYDTGDPIEIALKILTGWTISERYFRVGGKPRYGERIFKEKDFQKIFDISRIIVTDILEESDDLEAFKVAAQWVAILSWTGYDYPEVDEIKTAVKERVSKGMDKWFDVVVYGDATYLKDVVGDYTSWIIFKDSFIGYYRR